MFPDEIDELHEFKVKLAEDSVKMYEDLVQSSRLRWYDKAFSWWYIGFGITEFVIMTWCLVDHNWFSAGLSFCLGCLQFVLLRFNKRTKYQKLEWQAEWNTKLDKARKELEALDPNNRLMPKVIEEEP